MQNKVLKLLIVEKKKKKKGEYHGEAESASDLTVVIVPLLHLRLTSSKVRADKADASRVEQQSNGHTSFIACGPTHSSFYSINSDIPGKGINGNELPHM